METKRTIVSIYESELVLWKDNQDWKFLSKTIQKKGKTQMKVEMKGGYYNRYH
jgi:hypothetical protein